MWTVVFSFSSLCDASCTGLTEVRVERGRDWSCNQVTEYPNIQRPLLCSDENRFVPRILTIKNETIGPDRHRLALVPTFSYDDDGKLKYEFVMKSITCLPELSVNVDVVNRNQRTPADANFEFLFAIVLILLFMCMCVCSCLDTSDTSGGFWFGVPGIETPSKARFE